MLFGKSRTYWQRTIEGYLFIFPWLIGFIVFTAGALVGSFAISLTQWNLVGVPKFIGMKNYLDMIQDPLFWQSLKVTTLYLLNVPLNLALGLLLALLLNQKVRA